MTKQEKLIDLNKQIDIIADEIDRVKQFVNKSNYNCETALYVIAANYRLKLKEHRKRLIEFHDDLLKED